VTEDPARRLRPDEVPADQRAAFVLDEKRVSSAETFEVTGTAAWYDQTGGAHAPGARFDATIPEPQRSLLIQAGTLTVVPPAEEVAEETTLEELQATARELDITGRSKMTKEQLAEAIDAHHQQSQQSAAPADTQQEYEQPTAEQG
jgi:hypothetical protein